MVRHGQLVSQRETQGRRGREGRLLCWESVLHLLLILGLLLLAAAIGASARTLSLVIGIGEYEDPSISDLRFAVVDAMGVQAALELQCGASDTDQGRPWLLLDSAATRESIRDAFFELAEVAQPSDMVIVYYSGHGATAVDSDGDEQDGDGVDEALVPYDAEVGVASTYILDDELGHWVARISAGAVLLILDTCHSGGQGKSIGGEAVKSIGGPRVSARGTAGGNSMRDIFSDTGARRGRVILAACQGKEEAWESASLGHGVLTHFVLDGIEELHADANDDGEVTVDELGAYAAARTREWAGSSGRVQEPVYENPDSQTILLAPQTSERLAFLRDQVPEVLETGGSRTKVVFEVDFPNLFDLLYKRAKTLVDLSAPDFTCAVDKDHESRWAFYKELLRPRQGGLTWFQLTDCWNGDQVSTEISGDYCDMIFSGVHVAGVLCARATVCHRYEATFDMPPFPALTQFWYVSLDGWLFASDPCTS